MSLRQLTRQESHFLVQYLCDKKFQVRTRGFIRGDDPITVGATYEVQWGSQRQVDEAEILGSGTEKEMKVLSRQKQNLPTEQKRTTIKPKQPATVVARGRGQTQLVQPPATPVNEEQPLHQSPEEQPTIIPDEQPTEHITEEEPTQQSEDEVPAEHPDQQPTQRPLTETPTGTGTPSRPLFRINRCQNVPTPPMMSSFISAMESSMRQASKEREKMLKGMESLARQNQKLMEEVLTLRGLVDGLVSSSNNGRQTFFTPAETNPQSATTLTEIVEGVPFDLVVPEDELRRLHRESNNAGHFAAQLTKKMFPELYGPTNLRFLYNWYGGGQKKKTELDPIRKQLINRYVIFFHPEVSDSDVWRDRVVPKVNESLRRMEKKKPLQENASDYNINVSPSAFGGLMSYMNL